MVKQESNFEEMERLLRVQDDRLYTLQEEIKEREEIIEHKNMMMDN